MTAIAAAALFVGAALQSATGFGFALVAAPFLFAVLGPQEAVSAGVLLGLVLNGLTLATEGRRPRVLGGELVGLVGWSLPGIAAGAIALRELPDRLLSALVAVAVLGALGLRVWGRRAGGSAGGRGGADAAAGWRCAVAGATSGALSTSTSLSGPPLVFYLLARGAGPEQMRDTLAAIFIALSLLGLPVLLLTDTFEVPQAIVLLLVAGMLGQLLGRRGFARLGERHETAVLVVLALTAVVALASTVL